MNTFQNSQKVDQAALNILSDLSMKAVATYDGESFEGLKLAEAVIEEQKPKMLTSWGRSKCLELLQLHRESIRTAPKK